MKPDNSLESLAAVERLRSTGECLFNRTSSGSRRIHLFFIYRSNFDHKRYYHSFVGEIVCGRYAILRLR